MIDQVYHLATLLLATVVLTCSACNKPWRFSRDGIGDFGRQTPPAATAEPVGPPSVSQPMPAPTGPMAPMAPQSMDTAPRYAPPGSMPPPPTPGSVPHYTPAPPAYPSPGSPPAYPNGPPAQPPSPSWSVPPASNGPMPGTPPAGPQFPSAAPTAMPPGQPSYQPPSYQPTNQLPPPPGAAPADPAPDYRSTGLPPQSGPYARNVSFDPYRAGPGVVPAGGAMANYPPPQPGDLAFQTAPPVKPQSFLEEVLDDSERLCPPCSPYEPCQPAGLGGRVKFAITELGCNIRSDYRNYYSWLNIVDLLYGVSFGSVLANTNLDGDFQAWYQRDVRSSGTDDYAAFWKTFGEGQIFIPAFAGLGLVGSLLPEVPVVGCVGEFGDRVTRGYLVGAPPMLFMQYLLGGSRPDEADVGSWWKPFDDSNAVSGHAFMGAVPFITAAQMVENPLLKSSLYICSTFTAWSRVNDHDHYLSQACLGWWMAYLACRSVNQTESETDCCTFTPMMTPDATGIAMVVRR